MRGGAIVLIALAGCGRVNFGVATSLCPVGYLAVPGSAELGTADFCTMQFEAKAWQDLDGDGVVAPTELLTDGCDATCAPGSGVTTHVPVSVPDAQPWRALSQRDAAARCAALGPDFDLMSNPEWMTIARDLELIGANWFGGAPGAGRMPEGYTDGVGTGFAAVSNLNDRYSDTGNTAADPPGAGWEQRRALQLSTGALIWDLPGNVQEWIDWSPGPPLDRPPLCPSGELTTIACAGLADDDFNSSTGTYDSTHGVGKIIGGTGTAARRGGQSSDLTLAIAGIYALNMNRNPDDTFPGTGFRCVLR